jgi:hypothetical protein
MKIKKERRKEVKTKGAYVYIANTDKHCDLLHDRPVLSSRRTPHVRENRNCTDHSQNLVISPRGAERQDGLTD